MYKDVIEEIKYIEQVIALLPNIHELIKVDKSFKVINYNICCNYKLTKRSENIFYQWMHHLKNIGYQTSLALGMVKVPCIQAEYFDGINTISVQALFDVKCLEKKYIPIITFIYKNKLNLRNDQDEYYDVYGIDNLEFLENFKLHLSI